MKSARKLAATILASFDWMISQVENHQGLIEAASSEMQEAGEKAKIQLQKLNQDGLQLRKHLLQLAEQKSAWQQRTLAIAKIDRARALECLRRRRSVQKEIVQLEEHERRRAAFERQLSLELASIEERLNGLHKQRKQHRAVHSYSESLKNFEGVESKLLAEIDQILERWDGQIRDYQALQAKSLIKADALEDDFLRQEEEKSLQNELDGLLGGICHE